jgi:putative transposase
MQSDLPENKRTDGRNFRSQANSQSYRSLPASLKLEIARRLDQEAPGVAASILEGLDEMLTVDRLGLPTKLRRSLACTNSIENMIGTVRRVRRNVKRWRNAAMALRWTAAGMMEAAKDFRRLKAYKQLPICRSRCQAARHQEY